MIDEVVEKLFSVMMEYIEFEYDDLTFTYTDDKLKEEWAKIVLNYVAACVLDSSVRNELGI